MELVDVDVVGAQPLQAAITVLLDVFGSDVPAAGDLAGYDHLLSALALVKAAALHPLADGQL